MKGLAPHLALVVATSAGRLFPETGVTVGVSVVDHRTSPEARGAVVEPMKAAAIDAVRTLGMKSGAGGALLEVGVEDFRVSPGGAGYGRLTVKFAPPNWGEPTVKTYNVAYFAAGAASARLYRQAAWETAAATLLAARPAAADPARIAGLLSMLDSSKDAEVRRSAIFRLGIAGKDNPAVKEKLLRIFRTAKERSLREGAVEAIGMLGIDEAKEEILGALDGTKKVGGWDASDREQAWYLIKAAHRLGVQDLQSHLPKTDEESRTSLADLARFLQTGENPVK